MKRDTQDLTAYRPLDREERDARETFLTAASQISLKPRTSLDLMCEIFAQIYRAQTDLDLTVKHEEENGTLLVTFDLSAEDVRKNALMGFGPTQIRKDVTQTLSNLMPLADDILIMPDDLSIIAYSKMSLHGFLKKCVGILKLTTPDMPTPDCSYDDDDEPEQTISQGAPNKAFSATMGGLEVQAPIETAFGRMTKFINMAEKGGKLLFDDENLDNALVALESRPYEEQEFLINLSRAHEAQIKIPFSHVEALIRQEDGIKPGDLAYILSPGGYH